MGEDLRKMLLKNCKCGASMPYNCTCNDPYIITNREYKELEEKHSKTKNILDILNKYELKDRLVIKDNVKRIESLEIRNRVILKTLAKMTGQYEARFQNLEDQIKAFGIEMDRIEKKFDEKFREEIKITKNSFMNDRERIKDLEKRIHWREYK